MNDHRNFDLYRDKPLPNVLTTSDTNTKEILPPHAPASYEDFVNTSQSTNYPDIPPNFSDMTFEELREKFLDLAYAKFNSDSALHVATKMHEQLLIKIDNMAEVELNLLTQISFYQNRIRALEEVIAKEYN